MYKKCEFNVRYTELINKELVDSRNSHMKNEGKSVTVADIDLVEADGRYLSRIRDMLRHHEAMWNGHMSDIEVAKHAIELNDGDKPFEWAFNQSQIGLTIG